MFALKHFANLKSNILNKIMSYYAVARGHEVGIFDTWAKCEKQVKGFKGAKYKKFKSKSQAEDFIKINGGIIEKGKPLNNLIPLGKKGFNIYLEGKDLEKVFSSNAKPGTGDDYWPECDGDNFDLADSDLVRINLKGVIRINGYISRFPKKLLALQEYEEDSFPATCSSSGAGGDSSKSKKRKNPSSDAKTDSWRNKIPKYESKVWKPVDIQEIGAHSYLVDSEGFVICYTDGSCFNNGKSNACAGFGVFFDDDHPLNAAKPVKGRVTNNAGEIQAAIHAIKTAKSQGIKKLCISTDSQFLIKSITLWIKAWKRKGWCLKNGDPVKNVDDFKELDSLLSNDSINIKWNYVKGHKGIKGNEMADRLARQGTEMYKRMHKMN